MRTIFGLVVALCAFGTLTASAFALKPPKEPVFYGEFTASMPHEALTEGVTKGKGEVSELRLGPFKEIKCKKISSSGIIKNERSTSFPENVKFSGCETWIKLGEGIETRATLGLDLGLVYHSNGSAKTGVPANLEIEPTEVTFKASGTKCVVKVPAQEVPMKAEKKPEPEEAYEFATYETEPVEIEHKKELEEFFPATVREKLNIGMEFKQIVTEITPNEKCRYSKEEEGKFNKEKGTVVFKGGHFEGALEDIELKQNGKKGNVGFDPEKPEV